MKRLTALLTTFMLVLAACAQREHDFASHYMERYGRSHNLSCKTVSPKMMERIMELESIDGDRPVREVLSQLRTGRILTAGDTADARQLFDYAAELARRNAKRYRLYAQRDNLSVYVRRHGRAIVELVAVRLKGETDFSLIDFTGNMSEDIIEQILRI